MRLQDYINMTASSAHSEAASLLGTVYTETVFLERFARQLASPINQQQPVLSKSTIG